MPRTMYKVIDLLPSSFSFHLSSESRVQSMTSKEEGINGREFRVFFKTKMSGEIK
jgi:hypothetical protein